MHVYNSISDVNSIEMLLYLLIIIYKRKIKVEFLDLIICTYSYGNDFKLFGIEIIAKIWHYN